MTKIKKQISIVDDDASVCSALSVLLETYGYAVDTFLAAKDFCRKRSYSVCGCILLDIFMPEMDGWEVLMQIARDGLAHRVIVISASKNGSLEQKATDAGAFGYLQKPIGDQELIELIESAFENGENMDKYVDEK